MKCGHRWRAPFLIAPGASREVIIQHVAYSIKGDRVWVEQICIEEKGHDGPHKSFQNVTKEHS